MTQPRGERSIHQSDETNTPDFKLEYPEWSREGHEADRLKSPT